MFNLVVLDDERGVASDLHKNVTDWGFAEPFVALHKAEQISECLEIPRKQGWRGDWLFLLDCNLSDNFDGTYGGFKAWSLLVNEEPEGRPAFAVVYSQSIGDLIQAANAGGARAAQALRPKLFKRATDENSDIEPWWRCALEWLCERQIQIIKNTDSAKRMEICKRLRETLSRDSPDETRALFNTLALEVSFPGMHSEVWTLEQIFPRQAHAISKPSPANGLWWQENVIEVCYSLLPQFPKVLNEIGRLIFDDLSRGDTHEREFGRMLNSTIYHAALASEGTPLHEQFHLQGIRQWFQNNLLLTEHRLAASYHLLPPSLYDALMTDEINAILKALSTNGAAGHLADTLEALSAYCARVNREHPWRKCDSDPRRDFTQRPITCAVAHTIEGILDAQAARYGKLPRAVPLPPPLVENDRTYYVFKTQEPGAGEHLNPELMVERCMAERSDPLKHHLAGLVEIVCGQYRGEVHVLQEIRKERAFPRPDRVAVFSASGGNLQADAVTTLPEGLPLELFGEGRIESYTDPDDGKTLRPRGTYYVLVFPHWSW